MGAGLLSLVPTLVPKDDHWWNGKCLGGKERIDFVIETEANGVSLSSSGDFFTEKKGLNLKTKNMRNFSRNNDKLEK